MFLSNLPSLLILKTKSILQSGSQANGAKQVIQDKSKGSLSVIRIPNSILIDCKQKKKQAISLNIMVQKSNESKNTKK